MESFVFSFAGGGKTLIFYSMQVAPPELSGWGGDGEKGEEKFSERREKGEEKKMSRREGNDRIGLAGEGIRGGAGHEPKTCEV